MTAPSLFDSHARGYQREVEKSIAFVGKKHDFYLQAKAGHLAALAARRFPKPHALSVLEVGCGVGLMARKLVPFFGRVQGIDVSAEAVREARRAGGGVSYSLYDGARLPFKDAAFDIVLATCLLHHVPCTDRRSLAGELVRISKPTGGIVVFEHNPFHPLTRIAVSGCEFDREAQLLAMGETCSLLAGAGARILESRYILFLPFGGRIAGGVERVFRKVPLGAQYLVFACAHSRG